MKGGLLVLILMIQVQSFGQEGKVEIVKDPRVDNLIKKQSTVIPPATSPQMSGYRVQVFFDTDKKAVDDARTKLMNAFPKMDTYMLFNVPNYVLKAGDFRTQLEAEAFKHQIQGLFPASFITKEQINLPRIEQ